MRRVRGPGGDEPVISTQEERELRRVYDCLCDCHLKSQLRQQLAAALRRAGAGGGDGDGAEAETERRILAFAAPGMVGPRELGQLDEAGRGTAGALAQVEAAEAGTIKPIDLAHAMRSLGRPCSKRAVTDMIWEVDENLDGECDYREFRLMFARNVSDDTGLEPSSLFHLVQFMIYDKDGKGTISVDNTMDMLFARYGRAKMEVKIRELFGGTREMEGRELGFAAYLEAVEKTQRQTFLASRRR